MKGKQVLLVAVNKTTYNTTGNCLIRQRIDYKYDEHCERDTSTSTAIPDTSTSTAISDTSTSTSISLPT